MKPAIRIALMYALLSGVYILLSDYVALGIARGDPEALTKWQSVKGLAFVGTSAVMIFLLVLHYARSRDRAEKQRLEASRSFEELFQRNPIPVIVYDTEELRFLAVNQAMIDEYGYSREEFMQMKLNEICLKDELEKVVAHVARVKSRAYTGQWRQVRKDGSLFEVEVTSHPIVFGGRTARLVAAVNITARKITERALAEAFDAKEEAGEAKTRFLSTISHEMRTPLNAITGCLDLLLRERDESRKREFVSIAQRSTGDLLALIERLIDAAVLSSRPVRREMKDIQTEPFLRRLTDGFFQAAVQKKIRLDLEIQPSLPKGVRLDANRLEETLQILLGNAIKFSGGGVVKVSAGLRREAGRVLFEISVSDEGIGIPSSQQGKIFDSFFQVDQDLTRKYGGAGMGLFVAKQLCDLMAASIQVESVVGSGSMFRVSLPGEIDGEGRFVAGESEKAGQFISPEPPRPVEI